MLAVPSLQGLSKLDAGGPAPHSKLSLKENGDGLQMNIMNHAHNPGEQINLLGNTYPKLLTCPHSKFEIWMEKDWWKLEIKSSEQRCSF